MTALYTGIATATAGRQGHAETSDGAVKVELSMPKEMGGEGKTGATNPEQLFGLTYGTCFGGAVALTAKNQGKKIEAPVVTAHVTLNKEEEKGLFLSVKLDVQITGLSKEETTALVQEAHKICPYSKAIRGNVDVTFA